MERWQDQHITLLAVRFGFLLAPAQCLAHWILPREEHFLLDLSYLSHGEQEDVKRLIGFLYPMVCVPEFMGDNP